MLLNGAIIFYHVYLQNHGTLNKAVFSHSVRKCHGAFNTKVISHASFANIMCLSTVQYPLTSLRGKLHMIFCSDTCQMQKSYGSQQYSVFQSCMQESFAFRHMPWFRWHLNKIFIWIKYRYKIYLKIIWTSRTLHLVYQDNAKLTLVHIGQCPLQKSNESQWHRSFSSIDTCNSRMKFSGIKLSLPTSHTQRSWISIMILAICQCHGSFKTLLLLAFQFETISSHLQKEYGLQWN